MRLEGPRKSKRGRGQQATTSGKASKKQRKASSSSQGPEEDEKDGEDEEDGEDGEEKEEVDPASLIDQGHREIVDTLLADMVGARTADRKAIREGKPGLKRLELLSRVRDTLIKKILFPTIFKLDGSGRFPVHNELALWLSKLPDHSFPHQLIRSTIFNILIAQKSQFLDEDPNDMKDLLVESKLGSAVKFFAHHFPDETLENKKLANDLVLFWVRLHRGDFEDGSRPQRVQYSASSAPKLTEAQKDRVLQQAKWKEYIGPRILMPQRPSFEGLTPVESDDAAAFRGSDSRQKSVTVERLRRLTRR